MEFLIIFIRLYTCIKHPLELFFIPKIFKNYQFKSSVFFFIQQNNNKKNKLYNFKAAEYQTPRDNL